jgi:hypothetical protein
VIFHQTTPHYPQQPELFITTAAEKMKAVHSSLNIHGVLLEYMASLYQETVIFLSSSSFIILNRHLRLARGKLLTVSVVYSITGLDYYQILHKIP